MKILHRLRKGFTRAVWLLAYLAASFVIAPIIGVIHFQYQCRHGFLR